MPSRQVGQVFSYCIVCKCQILHYPDTPQHALCPCYKGAKWVEAFVQGVMERLG